MKIIFEKDKMIKALNSVTKAVATKTTMPILEGILIQTNNDDIKLTCYDKELGIEYIIKENNVLEQGSTVVNAIMFSEIIRKLPDTNITISINENNLLVIECEGSVYKLATMNPDDFPQLPEINVENSIELEQNTLKDMIRKTIFAISTEENRPVFTGCLFEVKNNKLNVVAVDGFRLAWKSKILNTKTNDFEAVIPGRTLQEINKILIDSFDLIKLGIAKNQALFEIENCKIVTRLLDGEFLKYSEVIPKKWETRVRVNKNLISNCFERISLISSSSMETGDAKEEIFTTTEGQDLEAGFNPKFFLDVFRNIDDEEVYIDFGTSISPSVIRSIEDDGDYQYMILPVRLKKD